MPQFPPGVHLKGGRNSAESHRRNCREYDATVYPLIADLREQGMGLKAIARELTRRRIKTRHGYQKWQATQVRRILARHDGNSSVPLRTGGEDATAG